MTIKLPSRLDPLKQPVFRRIWLASLLSNFGLMIHGVSAAWSMTELSDSPLLVALVQSSLMLPTMIFSLAAGALADTYDRRNVALAALLFSITAATLLVTVTHLGLLTPTILLLFSFLIGTGYSLLAPAWQASVTEQVPRESLPQAIGLNSVSFNVARSTGPAVGGVIVAALGSIAGFIISTVSYIPILVVLYLWQRQPQTPRFPPERLLQAIFSGIRYVAFSPPIRNLLLRAATAGLFGGALLALMPLVAREVLSGGAALFGLILGVFGVGAIFGSLGFAGSFKCKTPESAVQVDTLAMGLAIMVTACSPSLPLTCVALLFAGSSWMSLANRFNVGIQTSAPRWVAGRALATFQASICGGIASAGLLWGWLTGLFGVDATLLSAGLLMTVLPLLGRWFPVPNASDVGHEIETAREITHASLPVNARSGPIILTIKYRVKQQQARDFYKAIQLMRESRLRNGAADWSLSRDVDDPAVWLERFQFPTWLDYLRHRDRPTRAERELRSTLYEYHQGPGKPDISRLLGRPIGSVRWEEEVSDSKSDESLQPQI